MLAFPIFSTFLLLLSTVYAQCIAPVIDGASMRTVTRTTFTITGSASVATGCSKRFLLVSQESGTIEGSISVDASGKFSRTVRDRPLGKEHYYLVHPTNSALRSSVITVSIVCNTPTIDTPRGDDTKADYDPDVPVVVVVHRPAIIGRSDCPFVTIEIFGHPSVTVATNDNGYFNVRAQPLSNGAYAMTAIASSDGQSDSARSRVTNVQVISQEAMGACKAPVITSHRNPSTAPTDFVLSGTVDVGSDCDTGLLRLMSQETGEIQQITTDGSGYFSSRLINQSYGLNHYYILYASDTNRAFSSRVVAITIICDTPTILQPGASDGEPVHAVPVSTSRPIFSGYSRCGFVTISLPNQQSVTLKTDANGAFSLQWSQLRNAQYVLNVVASPNAQGTYSSQPNTRKFTVSSTDPYPTGSLQRRASYARSKCLAEEEMCLVSPIGRKQRGFHYECISDTSSNLERCGSCTGPDCSALPNVDGVLCQEGKCKVLSCVPGHILVENACV